MITTKISDRAYLLDTMALGQPNTVGVYVLKGEKTALVDCGYASTYTTVLEGLRELGIRPSEVDYLIPTHVHLDHGGGAGLLLREMPRAKVIAQERGIPHLVDPTRLVESATKVFGAETIKLYGVPVGIDAQRITGVGEEMHLDLGGVSLTMIHAPGHAPHQISVLVEESRLLLSADAVGIVYPAVRTMIPTTPPPSLNPVELAATTEKLEQLDSRMLLVPHYGVREDSREVLALTRKKTDEWVAKVKSMANAGTDDGAILGAMMGDIEREAGIAPGQLPPYAQISVKITVDGILYYLRKSGQTKA